MASSDSDSDIFLTQSSFRSTMEYTQQDNTVSFLEEFSGRREIYQPVLSDISDDEMIAASIAVEENENIRQDEKKQEIHTANLPTAAPSSRFGKPKEDHEMINITRRRYKSYSLFPYTFFYLFPYVEYIFSTNLN
jgi:hypothetical protein